LSKAFVWQSHIKIYKVDLKKNPDLTVKGRLRIENDPLKTLEEVS